MDIEEVVAVYYFYGCYIKSKKKKNTGYIHSYKHKMKPGILKVFWLNKNEFKII